MSSIITIVSPSSEKIQAQFSSEESINYGQIAGVIAQINEGFKEHGKNEARNVNLGSEIRVSFDGSDEPKKVNPNGSIDRLGYPVLSEYQTEYPPIVAEAIIELYQEYRKAFIPLIEKNREWETDYQYCKDKNGIPIIYGVQVDMQPLPADFLQKCKEGRIKKEVIKEGLRRQIFEIEGSMAMTPLLEVLFESVQTQNTLFKQANRQMFNGIREKFEKPIVMLAVTDKKRNAILESEFGMNIQDGRPSAEDIYNKSGLNDVWGPEEFLAHLEKHGEENLPLFYVRSSDPVDKLKNPDAIVEHPLLGNDELRRMIKANSLTLNINNPNDLDVTLRINDTKEYMEEIGMAYPVNAVDDIFNQGYRTYLDVISKRENLKSILATLNVEISSVKKQNNDLLQNGDLGNVIKKRLGQNRDEGNQNRLQKLKDMLEYSKYKKAKVESDIKSQFSEKEAALRSAIGLFDKIVQRLEQHLGIIQKGVKNKATPEQQNLEFNQNIIKLNKLLTEIDLPSLDFENIDKFSSSPFNDAFRQFLESRGISTDKIVDGTVTFRGKPLTDAYGCYGHLPKENILDLKFIQRLEKEMNERGRYVFQVEMPQCIVKDTASVFENGNLSPKFIHFLETRQIPKTEIDSIFLRSQNLKPQDLIQELAKAFPLIKKEFWFNFSNENDPQCSISYVTIDRNFFFPDISGNDVNIISGGGFRSMISTTNQEAKEGRVHGNDETRWAPVIIKI